MLIVVTIMPMACSANMIGLTVLLIFCVGQIDSFLPGLVQIVRIEYFSNCPKTNTPIKLENTRISQVNKNTYAVNSKLNIPKSQPTNLPSAKMTLKKCSSRADLSTCEHYMRFDVTDFCGKLKEKDQIWSGMVQAFSPPIECPIKQVSYTQKNGTIDAALVGKVTPEGFVWSYDLEIFQNKNLIACNTGVYEIQRVKN